MLRNASKLIAALGLTAAALSAGSTAHAAAILNVDGSVTFDNTGGANTIFVTFNGLGDAPSGGGKVLVPGLSGTLSLTLDSIVSNVFSFSYAMTNTSTVTDAGISGFGFSTTPGVTGGTTGGSGDVFPLGDFNGANFASFGADVCFHGGPGNCPQSGGGNRLEPGDSGNGEFTLTFSGTPTSVTLSDFLNRYQGFSTPTISGNTVTSAVGQGVILPSVQAPVPEPSTWLMMIFGFGLVGGLMRQGKGQSLRSRRLAAA